LRENARAGEDFNRVLNQDSFPYTVRGKEKMKIALNLKSPLTKSFNGLLRKLQFSG